MSDRNKESAEAPWRELPEDLAEALRPALAGLADEIVAAVGEGIPAYRGQLSGGYGRNIRAGVEQALAGFVELVAAGARAGLPGRSVYMALGAGELREGRSLESLLAAYRLGARVAWRGLIDAGEAAGVAPATMYRTAEALFAYIDELSAASAEGYAQEQSRRAGQREARRRALLERLLATPTPGADEISELAGGADWSPPPRVAALAWAAADGDRVARRLPPDALVAPREDALVALLGDPEAPGLDEVLAGALDGRRGALGPAVELEHAGESARRALATLGLGAPGLRHAGDHAPELLLAADRAVAADLSARRLAPLDELRPSARARLTVTLAAWLEHQGDVRATAEALHVHVQTVRYRLAQLREVFGDALDDGRARLELALALLAVADV
ncbi:MAG TPA: helix-turn-helix domain-containing protein [Solirubrobacteraceae bacterium]|nr:helix-turn-helix domain-containing protein [Solirubrobacteraceae bacterium]